MLDKKKIRLMTRTAIYEKKYGEQDIKISGFYKKDYASFHTWVTLIWITAGYLLAAGLFCLCCIDSLLEDLTLFKLIILAAIAVGAYLILLIVYGIGSGRYYRKRHSGEKRRVKKYYRALAKIEKLY